MPAMQLIGMLDSPYVRRVAVSLELMGLPYQLQPLSVFSTFAQFSAINPVVKAPTLVCADGTVLMDSSLILDYAEHQPGLRRSLMPAEPALRLRTLRLTGLALAVCEKAVQLVYERQLRPPDHQHEPWRERVRTQLQAACTELEAELSGQPLACTQTTIDQAGVCASVAWTFMQNALGPDRPELDLPALAAHAAQAETLPAFVAAPHGGSGWPPAQTASTTTSAEST